MTQEYESGATPQQVPRRYLLTRDARVDKDRQGIVHNMSLYMTESAKRHVGGNRTDLKKALVVALGRPSGDSELGGERYEKTLEAGKDDVYQVKWGKGKLVYKEFIDEQGLQAAEVFHYHHNYGLDKPLPGAVLRRNRPRTDP